LSQGMPHAEEVRAALDLVLAWPALARSPQLGQFLRYIVDRTLDGEPQAIKAYAIAVDVLGRPADFDPQVDPIVRVQARRLRSMLDSYYEGPGADDPVRIVLPIGRYVPEFAYAPAAVPVVEAAPDAVEETPPPLSPPGPKRDRRRALGLLLALVVAVGAGVGGIALFDGLGARMAPGTVQSARIEPPRVSVTDFANEAAAADLRAPLARGLALELVTDLDQFGTIEVRYGTSPAFAAGPEVSPDFLLGGSVTELAGRWQYQAHLTEIGSERVVWSKTIEVLRGTSDDGVLDTVSGRLSQVLGSPRGPLHARARALLEDGSSLVGRETTYLCRMLFDLFREREAPSEGQRTAACIAALTPEERAGGTALAIEAGLAIASVPGREGAAGQSDALAQAEALLDRATLVAPTSAFVWEQRARLAEMAGVHRAAQEAYGAALQLNPANLDTLAGEARHLALIGQMDRAVMLAGRP
jgi:TolB-like protein